MQGLGASTPSHLVKIWPTAEIQGLVAAALYERDVVIVIKGLNGAESYDTMYPNLLRNVNDETPRPSPICLYYNGIDHYSYFVFEVKLSLLSATAHQLKIHTLTFHTSLYLPLQKYCSCQLPWHVIQQHLRENEVLWECPGTDDGANPCQHGQSFHQACHGATDQEWAALAEDNAIFQCIQCQPAMNL